MNNLILPIAAQQSPVYAISVTDIDGDNIKDIIIGGNVSHAQVAFWLLQGKSWTNFKRSWQW